MSSSTATGDDIDETLKRIGAEKNVIGAIVMDRKGRVMRSTLADDAATEQHANLVHQLVLRSSTLVTELDASNDLTLLRLTTTKHEMICVPEKDYLLVVLENLKG